MLMIFTIFPQIHINISAAAESDFSLSLKWRNTNTADCALNITSSDVTTVTLATIYESTNKDHPAYEPGELTIVVPGIGNVYRGNNVAKLYDIAADLDTETDKKYDWSYTYDSENDIYTFTNNNEIPAGGNFVGSFEIVYNLSSRSCENGYNQTLKASLSVANDDTVCESEAANFSVTTQKDKYNPLISAQKVFNPKRIEFEEDVSNYIWVDYIVYGGFYKYARGVEDGEYFEFTINSDIKVAAITDSAKVSLADSLQITQNADGTTTYRYKYDISNYSSSSSPWNHIYLAFPKSEYLNTEFDFNLNIIGKYYEEENEEILSEITKNIDLTIYSQAAGYFSLEHDIVGSVGKGNTNCGLNHDSIAYGSYVDGKKISKGATITDYIHAYNSTFEDEDSHYYDTMEITFEKLSVYLNDGTAEIDMPDYDEAKERTLDKTEYKYTEIYLPRISETSDGFDYDSVDLKVDIYVKTVDKDDEYLFNTVTPNNQYITLPENTYSIRLVYSNMLDYLYILPRAKAQLFINNDSGNIETDYGYVRSVVNFSLYDQQQHTENTYSGLKDAKRNDFQHIHKNLTTLGMDTYLYGFTSVGSDLSISDSGFTSKLRLLTTFVYADEDDVKSCSMYTILPQQLKLPNDVETTDDLYSHLTIIANGYETEFLKEHCNIIIDKNYRGSGRTYLGFEFDFSEQPIKYSISINVYVDVFLSQFDYIVVPNASSVSVTGICMATDIDNVELSIGRSYKLTDNGSCASPASLWSDIDNDGKTDDLLDYSSDSQNIVHASHTQESSIKFVSTSRVTTHTSTNEPVPADLASNYEYRLAVSTSETDATNVVFFDDLENNSGSEWQGTLVEVDTSFAESKGFEPIVYYSLYDDAPREDLSDAKWTTTPPDDMTLVKRIAVDLNGTLSSNSLMYVVLKMKAPGDDIWTDEQIQEYVGKVAKSTYTMKLTKLSSGDVYIDSNELIVELTEPASNVTVIKQDKDDSSNRLQGAKFELYNKTDNTLIDTVTTGVSGKAVFYNVPYGEYYLKETVSPLGYGASEESIDISVKLQRNIEVTVDNTKLSVADLTILKKDKTSQEPLKGVIFAIYRNNGDETSTLIKRNITTDANGMVTVTDLPYGNYYLKETTALTGYKTCDDIPFVIESDEGASITVENERILGTVNLTKVNSETGKVLSGAVFRLYDSENNPYGEDLTTDENGLITVTDLPWGDYYFEEIESPFGYEMQETSKKITFKIAADSTEINLSVANNEIFVSLNITKLENDTKEPLEGIKFSLYRDNGEEEDELIKDDIVTDANGQATITGIPYGNFYLQETEGPVGYDLVTVEFIVNGETIINGKIPDMTIYNQKTPGTVILTKKGTKTGRKISGALFNLYNEENDELVMENLETDSNGQITLTRELEWGKYYFKEMENPLGYTMDEDSQHISFEIKAEQTTVNLNVTNDEIPAKIKIIVREKDENGNIIDPYNPYLNLEEPNSDGDYDGHFFSGIDVCFNSKYYTTNEFGEVEIDNVLYGDYRSFLPELDGYRTPTITTINVTEGGTREFTLYYIRDTKFVEFVVRDDFGQPVPRGMRFDLYYKKTSNPNYSYIKIRSGLTTNNYGEIATQNLNLSWGCYRLILVDIYNSTDGTSNRLKYDLNSETYFIVNSIPGKSTIPVKSVYDHGNSLRLTSFPLLIECTVNRQKGTVNLFVESYETDSEGTNYNILDGKYSLYKTDGTLEEDGTLIAENLTVNNNNSVEVSGLDCGTYYFVETQTPKNHEPYTDKIPFVVNINNLNPTVIINSEADYKITLTKRINLSDIVFAHGNPTFVFKVTDSLGQVYSKSVEFTESYVNQYKEQHPNLDYVEMNVTFSGFSKGTYTVSEENPIRYAFEKVEELTENGKQSGQAVSFDLSVYENEGKAIFISKKVVQSSTSAASQSTSSFKAYKLEEPSVVGITYNITGATIPTVNDTSGVNDSWRTISNLIYHRFTIHYEYSDGTKESKTVSGTYVSLSDGGNVSEDIIRVLSTNFSSDYLVSIQDEVTGKTLHTFIKSVNYRESTILKQTQDGEVKIMGYRGNLKGVVNIPNKFFSCFMNLETQTREIKEWNVTKVGDDKCRYWNSNKYEINFAEGITEICDNALVAEAMKITLPKSLEKIGYKAFAEYDHLSVPARLRILEITGADDGTSKLTSIGSYAFSNCLYLKEINIPKTVTSIASYAFYKAGYAYTENISIMPSPGFKVNFLDFEDTTYSLTIGAYAFLECRQLKEIEIPERVSSIGNLAFKACTQLQKITIFKEPDSISGEPWGATRATVIWEPLP